MGDKRLKYLLYCIATIALGLLSRKFSFIPAFAGDVLYAVMMYWIFRFIFLRKTKSLALFLAIAFCFAIEFLQLVNTPLFNNIRQHKLLRLIFGQGFLWTDLLAYCAGAILARVSDRNARLPRFKIIHHFLRCKSCIVLLTKK